MALPRTTPPDNNRCVRERVSESLRAAIFSGEMLPDEVYSTPRLSRIFGVSATPVREAMLDLAHEGLVKAEPNLGFRVIAMTDKHFNDVIDLRLLIEPSATCQAAQLLTDEEVQHLRTVADRVVEASSVTDLAGYIAADTEFHLELIAALDNNQITLAVKRLRAQTRLCGLRKLAARGGLRESALEHHRMLDLIEQRRFTDLDTLMRWHLSHIRGIWAG